MRLRLLMAAAIGLLAAGCIPHDVRIGQEFLPTTQPTAMDYADWSLVLNRAIRSDGVDYAALGSQPEPLVRFLGKLGTVGPTATPPLFERVPDRSAYYINAYNAAVMYGVAAQTKDGAVPTHVSRSPTSGYRFLIDGQWRTPDQIRRLAMAESKGDWRVKLAMCAGRKSDPTPFSRPYIGDVLDFQLQQFAVNGFSNSAVLNVDAGMQYLYLHPAIYRVREQLVAGYQKRTGARNAEILAVLIDMARPNQYPLLNSALGFPVFEAPVNFSVNATSGMKTAEPGLFSRKFLGG